MAYSGNVTYGGTTIREDLSELIAIMTPADTPLNTLLDSREVHDTYYDWAMDELSTPTAVVNKGEGVTPSVNAGSEVTRAVGSLSIVMESVHVANSRRAVKEAGMTDAYNYQVWKASIATMKQMEYNMHWGVSTAVVTSDSSARSTVGLGQWILYQTDLGDGNTDYNINGKAFASFRNDPFYQATPADLTRAQLHATLGDAWNDGMNIDGSLMLCGNELKRVISEFALVYGSANTFTPTRPQRFKTMDETIDVFSSDYGDIYINMDRYMTAATTLDYPISSSANTTDKQSSCFFIIEPDMYHRTVLRGLSHVPLAVVGDATEGFCVAEMGLQCDNIRAGTGGTAAVV
mgnify:CR=1 FL=1|tara:strand:+ start:6694 stop:7734 length:1041 start_codon:yes stop_codon:yes gene_type:complete